MGVLDWIFNRIVNESLARHIPLLFACYALDILDNFS
jgi:hypothetical protein